jgi:hypothetical protein
MTKNKKVHPCSSRQHHEGKKELERNGKGKTVGKYKKLETFLTIILYKAETMQKEEEVLKLVQKVHNL